MTTDSSNNSYVQDGKLYIVPTLTSDVIGYQNVLNGYTYTLGSGLLVGQGATQSFSAGVMFWQRYGRILYNATAGQLAYNASYPNGTARVKPVLRTTGQSRIYNSEINWALGFFGPSYTLCLY